MNTSFDSNEIIKNEGLCVINTQREKIEKGLNEGCEKAMQLSAGKEKEAKVIFDNMISLIDIATMLDILTNEERIENYEQVFSFFQGVPTPKFSIKKLEEHYQMNAKALDVMMIQKINIQERMNENFLKFKEYSKKADNEIKRNDFLKANRQIFNFAKNYGILKEDEVSKAYKILSNYKRNVYKPEKLIFVPEQFYKSIPSETNSH